MAQTTNSVSVIYGNNYPQSQFLPMLLPTVLPSAEQAGTQR